MCSITLKSQLAKQSVRWLFEHVKTQNPIHLTDIQRAARFYALNRMAFGGGMKTPSFGYAQSSSARLSASRFKRNIDALSQRLDGVFIENSDWAACVQRYDRLGTLVYCDPPYYQTTNYGMAFCFEQHVKMAEIARTMKGKMIISVNDIPAMREVYFLFNVRLNKSNNLAHLKSNKRTIKFY